MKSIQARFVVLMIAIVSTLLGGFGFLSYADSKTQKNKQLQAHLQATQQRLSQSLPAVIWRFDREQIRQILDAELGSASIVNIAVYDEQNRLLHSAIGGAGLPLQWSEQAKTQVRPQGEFIHEFPLTLNVDQVTEPVGSVRVLASSQSIDQSLRREAIRLFALILLMNLVIVAALCVVMRVVIMRPLNAVRNALSDITQHGADLSQRLPPSPWREFEDVVDNFNALAQRLESALGASIDEVHQTISRIAMGDFSQPVVGASSAPPDTVIARLADMQHGLVALTAELRQAKQAADTASQAKTDFLAHMSHEIRTPLNAILGMTRLAMRAELPPQQREQLGKVVHSANHLLGVINEILDLSKIEAGKLTLEHMPFKLADVLESVVTLVGEKAVESGLELVTDVAADVPWSLVGDPMRLTQILVNFTNNAVKFTQRGEVLMYARQVSVTSDRVRLRLGVRDTGVGIPADRQSSLFQNFAQVDASNARQYGGTGLGLAISKQLAQLMQGRVGLRSVEGAGSDFWCEVELGYCAAPPVATLSTHLGDKPTRALVIDDQSTAREVLVQLLRAQGVDARGAPSGAQALHMLRDATQAGMLWDWVFIDRYMPDMDGVETATRIHALQLEPPPRLWLMSAVPAEELLPQARLAGVVGMLAKPVYAAPLHKLLQLQGGATIGLPDPLPAPAGVQALRASMGARVLLVEDIEINREVASGLLDALGLGLVIDFAEDGQVALQCMAQRHYDVVFMDMHMPVMDGLAATQAIRSHPEWDGIPVIAMTASNMDSDIQRCAEAGMCDFVTKPIDPAQLREAIRKWVIAKTVVLAPATVVRSLPLELPTLPVPPVDMVPAKARPLLAALQGVEGLDPESGLARFGGKQATYREMLRRFVLTHQAAASDLQRALDSGEITQLVQLSHALSEAALSVGAYRMAEHAQAIHTAAPHPLASKQLQEHIALLRQSTSATVAGIRLALPQVFATPAPIA